METTQLITRTRAVHDRLNGVGYVGRSELDNWVVPDKLTMISPYQRHALRNGEQGMLRASLERFRLIRERTLNQVKVLSQEQMDFSPPSGEWSIGEILDHLRLGERVFRKDFADLIDLAKAGKTPSIYRSFAEMNAAPAFIPQCVLPFLEPPLFVMNRFIPNNIRVSLARANLVAIRHPDVTTPSKGKSADTLRAELRASLQETESLFAANPALDYNAMTHEYPMLGIQTVPQLLDFLGIEESLHQGQIDRVIAEPRFPKAG